MSFYYWCWARKELGLSIPIFAVTLDRHSDLLPLPNDKRELAQFIDFDDLRRVKDFVDRALNDGNFITSAMECGLIGDMLIITQERNGHEYRSRDGKTHRIFYHEYSESTFRTLFDRKNVGLKRILRKYLGMKMDFVLDIDLDFFTYDCGDNVCVFSKESVEDVFSLDSLVWPIYQRARLLTISVEPYWSGSLENSRQAFELLKRYLGEKRIKFPF